MSTFSLSRKDKSASFISTISFSSITLPSTKLNLLIYRIIITFEFQCTCHHFMHCMITLDLIEKHKPHMEFFVNGPVDCSVCGYELNMFMWLCGPRKPSGIRQKSAHIQNLPSGKPPGNLKVLGFKSHKIPSMGKKNPTSVARGPGPSPKVGYIRVNFRPILLCLPP